MQRRKEQHIANNKQLAKQLLLHRVFYGRTQQEVAKVIDVSFQQYQKYEKCENRIFAEQLMSICKHYSWDIDVIFNGEPIMTAREWYENKVPNARSGVHVNYASLLEKFNKIDVNAYVNYMKKGKE